MNFLKKINPFRGLAYHLKINRILRNVYRTENIPENLSRLFGVRVRTDWVNRMYFVINVYDTNINDQVFEATNTGYSNRSWTEKWVFDRLNIANRFIRANNLFEVLTYELRDLGSGNFLFIFSPISWDDALSSIRQLGLWLVGLGLLGGIGWYLY